jgi:hypothetical protein
MSAIICFVLLLMTPEAHADGNSYGGMNDWLKVTDMEISSTRCVVAATIDYQAVSDNMRDIRDDWLVRDNSVDFYQKRIILIIYGVALHKAGGVLLDTVYIVNASRNPNFCHFDFSLKKSDQYGNMQIIPILNWDFTKAIESKINWDNFDDENLPDIALNYKFTDQANALLVNSGENDLLPNGQ